MNKAPIKVISSKFLLAITALILVSMVLTLLVADGESVGDSLFLVVLANGVILLLVVFLVIALSSRLVAAIEQSEEQLEVMQTTDELTGLLNRRAFDKALSRQAALACRWHTAALVLIDLDYFKTVNDTYGRAVGDEVLQTLTETLRTRCRETDVLARVGEDEFALILPGDFEQGVYKWHGEVQAMFIEKQGGLNGGNGLQVPCRISAGALTLDKNSEADADSLFHQVEARLFEAKQAGRGMIRL